MESVVSLKSLVWQRRTSSTPRLKRRRHWAAISLDALKKLMGDSLVLTLQFIFTEKGGINLRNNLSHGLYDPQNFYSPYAIYAWWIILKMCLFPVERAGSAEPLEE